MSKLIRGYIIAMRFDSLEREPLYVNLLADETFIEDIDQAFIFPTKDVADIFQEIVYECCSRTEFYIENNVYPCIEHYMREDYEI